MRTSSIIRSWTTRARRLHICPRRTLPSLEDVSQRILFLFCSSGEQLERSLSHLLVQSTECPVTSESKHKQIRGDSLVFIFPLALMLTFTSAVGKLNVRVLWHHHMLLQVISQRYCQVFVKFYNFVFEKIDKEGSPREK